MKRSKSSKKWMQEHLDDLYVKKARQEGYRGRAVYKLIEINEKEKLIKPGMAIIDLGAAPGSWSQYVSKLLNGNGTHIALDILQMDSISDVTFIQGDFLEETVFDNLLERLGNKPVDLILSDMAPNATGLVAVDIPRAMYLAELAFDLATKVLKPGGNLLIKIFHGAGFDALLKLAKSEFKQVLMRKPAASRARSRESYLLAKGFHL